MAAMGYLTGAAPNSPLLQNMILQSFLQPVTPAYNMLGAGTLKDVGLPSYIPAPVRGCLTECLPGLMRAAFRNTRSLASIRYTAPAWCRRRAVGWPMRQVIRKPP